MTLCLLMIAAKCTCCVNWRLSATDSNVLSTRDSRNFLDTMALSSMSGSDSRQDCTAVRHEVVCKDFCMFVKEMWPSKLLEKIAPVVWSGQDAKLKEHYDAYVTKFLHCKWTSEASKITSLIDFRDFAEDAVVQQATVFGLSAVVTVPIDRLVRALKSNAEGPKRQSLSVAYIEENCLAFRPHVGPAKLAPEFVAFALERELQVFYKHAEGLTRFRPLLKCSLESLEQSIKVLETTGTSATLETFQTIARNLGLTTLWPTLALWYSIKMGDVEEVFLNVPMPRVFGAPSCVRNAIERKGDPTKLVKTAFATKKISLDNSVLSGHGHVAYKVNNEFKVFKASRAYLTAPLPGMDTRHIWCLKPETLEAAIYKLEPEFKLVAEFELPRDETEESPNWIDCQRDSEGALVLLWGHINSLTGSLYTQNAAALDEEAILAASGQASDVGIEFLSSIASMPTRRVAGQRIDWRDHGNLLSVHHSVEDSTSEGSRLWTHAYDIVFGSNLLLTLTTDARPIESIFGSPEDVVLLSPLSSSEPLQHWTLVRSSDSALPEYKMAASCKAPKLDSGHWQNVVISL